MFMLDPFVGYRKTDQARALQGQQLTVNGIPLKKRPTAGW